MFIGIAMDKIMIGQIFSITATIVTFLSYQTNSKKWVLIIQTIATFLTCVAYFFLGATSGFVLNIVCIIRNIVFYFTKEGTKTNRLLAYLLAGIIIVLGVFSWQKWYSLLIIVALSLNTLFLSLGNQQILRKSVLFTSSLIAVYNIIVFSIGGIANELLAVTSSAIGIIRFKQSEKSQAD